VVCKGYLKKVLKPVVKEICKSNDSFELDARYLTPGEDRSKNVQLLKSTATAILNRLVETVDDCPMQLRILANHLTNELKRYHNPANEYTYSREASIILLKFVIASLIKPEDFGIVKEILLIKTRRKLIVLAKILVNICYEVEFSEIELDFKIMNDFVTETKIINTKREFLRRLGDINPPTEDFPSIYSLPLDFQQLRQGLQVIIKYFRESLDEIGQTLYWGWRGTLLQKPCESLEFFDNFNVELQSLEKRLSGPPTAVHSSGHPDSCLTCQCSIM